DGLIYTLAPGATEPRRVPIRLASDWKANDERVISFSGGIGEYSLSPNGKEFAFIYRGEVFVSSIGAGTTQRITNTPAPGTRGPLPDGGNALGHAAGRGGRWGIHEARRVRAEEPYLLASALVEEAPVVVNDRQNSQPLPSPDGKRLAYIEDRHTLKVLD